MPIRRECGSQQFPFIEAIIRKFESQNRVFVICNATTPHVPIIYSSDRFFEFTGFSRPEVMKNNYTIQLLHGPRTDLTKIRQIEAGVRQAEEVLVQLCLYRKDGTEMLCNVILIPVRNETSVVVLYILNFEDVTAGKDPKDTPSNPIPSSSKTKNDNRSRTSR
ncbi:potassium voltage-gated channel subfamily H member 2-like [Paramacrobiotus metropolitanus]|uniref:potassium voltage-gated channel subfamily H member 2-like n=1 Tax=Paramacrobiotus metropolitanus TaxID=2943436 RepID=UPI002445A247|nr:potassium voltage-gated channel subfamily H member 2-like [Paramacrobiotus metropolitanus]